MTAPEALVGALFAEKFQIERLVGEGGMGWVYRARNVLTHGPVAIKVVREDRSEPSIVRRMLSEARTLAKLSHPNIVRLFDAGTWEGQFYLVEEFIDGRSLREVLSEQLVMDRRAVIELLVSLLDALEYAHARAVVHRDIKPENILLVDDGRSLQPKLIDFSIALALADDRHTRAGTILGTPRYMSPEQAWGREDIDARSDLWSLAAVAYECLSGSPPYDGPNDRAVLAEIVSNDPPALGAVAHSVDEQLADVVMRALVRARDQRTQSAAAWRDALLALDGPVRAEPWFIALRARHGHSPEARASAPSPPVANVVASEPAEVEPVTAPPVERALVVHPKKKPNALVLISSATLVVAASAALAVRASHGQQPVVRAAEPRPIASITTNVAHRDPLPLPLVDERDASAAPSDASSPRVVAQRATSTPRAVTRSSRDASASSSSSSTTNAAVSVGTNRAPIVEDEP